MAGLTPALVSYRDCDCEEPITEENFQAAADLQEGISGRRSMVDTTYENYDKELVNRPRSESNSLEKENDTDKPWRNWTNNNMR